MSKYQTDYQEISNELEDIHDGAALHWVHWCVLAGSLVLTFGAWYFAKLQIEEKTMLKFDREVSQVVKLVSERMQKYEDALWSGVAVIEANGGNTDNQHWRTFSNRLHLNVKYPGINGIGVVHYLPTTLKLDQYLFQKKAERAYFDVHPKRIRKEYLPITYIEPFMDNQQAIGLDLAHETNRYRAALKARDTGKAQITGPITLVQDAAKTPGFLFYTPFYKNGLDETLDQRQQNFTGLVYAPFVMNKLMAGTLDQKNRHVSIRVTDGAVPLYDELKPSNAAYDPEPQFTKSVPLTAYGRTWNFKIQSSQSFRALYSNNQPWIILFGGISIDTLLFILFILLTRSNRRAITLTEKVTQSYQLQLGELNAAKLNAENANKLKSSFLANMSHEIRTPLNGVMGMAQLLGRTELNETQKDYVKTICSSSTSLLTIIEDVLDISKIEAGLIELWEEEYDVEELVKIAVNTVSGIAVNKGLNIRYQINEDCHENYTGDPKRIRQVLINMLGNAVKFTDSGEISVLVEKNNDGKLLFKINDTGPGITAINQLKIFDRFSQVDNTDQRSHGGSGLGLTISKDLCHLMGGEIGVDSTPGNGSTFWFTIPAVLSDDLTADEIQKDLKTPERLSSDSRLKILLAEDNLVNQMVISEALNDEGIELVMVNNGLEALAQLDQRAFDIVLMDIQMPKMSGDEAIKRIRRSDQTYKDIPIIILSANALKEAIDEYMELGANEYLSKPIDIDQLIQKINEHCQKRVLNNAA